MKESLVFHANGTSSGQFERNLASAVERCEDDGYEVISIDHQSHLALFNRKVSRDNYEPVQFTLYSAVVWCQREVAEVADDTA